jgi:hypothetical protein
MKLVDTCEVTDWPITGKMPKNGNIMGKNIFKNFFMVELED